MSIIGSVFWFLVVTCVLVAWHEFGHFWVGRKCGVKVLRYAIGFGPAVWKRTGSDGIEYAINAIPLGGYVKFADTRDGSVEPQDVARAFDKASLSKRSLIVLAGPVANLIFAIAAFWLMFMIGVRDDRAVLGTTSGQAQLAGLMRGDEIVQINGTEVGNWTTAHIELMQLGYDKQRADLRVRNALLPASEARTVVLDLTNLPAKFDETGVLSVLGMEPFFFNPDTIVSEMTKDGPAARSGLLVGEHIVAVGGVPVSTRKEFIEQVQILGKANAGKISITAARNGIRREVLAAAENNTLGGVQAWRLGIVFEGFDTTRQLGPISALSAGVGMTWYYCTRTLGMIKSLLTGQASAKNVSGPITIAQLADLSAKQGPSEFLKLLAGISLSLFIVNLLPVPILDGGQLLFFAMEKIKGAPLGERAMEAGGIIGILVLFGLMTLAITNDLTRTLGL
jgi:regulator of sigma E protease